MRRVGPVLSLVCLLICAVGVAWPVAGQIVRSEDFTQTPSQGIWSLGTFEHGTGSISSGSYHLAVDDGWVQLSRLGGAFGDFTASTQLTLLRQTTRMVPLASSSGSWTMTTTTWR
jgi:hypothetical protein